MELAIINGTYRDSSTKIAATGKCVFPNVFTRAEIKNTSNQRFHSEIQPNKKKTHRSKRDGCCVRACICTCVRAPKIGFDLYEYAFALALIPSLNCITYRCEEYGESIWFSEHVERGANRIIEKNKQHPSTKWKNKCGIKSVMQRAYLWRTLDHQTERSLTQTLTHYHHTRAYAYGTVTCKRIYIHVRTQMHACTNTHTATTTIIVWRALNLSTSIPIYFRSIFSNKNKMENSSRIIWYISNTDLYVFFSFVPSLSTWFIFIDHNVWNDLSSWVFFVPFPFELCTIIEIRKTKHSFEHTSFWVRRKHSFERERMR